MKTIVAGALGECVHVAGVFRFLQLAEKAGWRTVFLGPAVNVDTFIETARSENADLVGVSYRLTPETGERLLAEFSESADELREQGTRFVFGGTPPVAARAKALGFFERVFDGSEPVEDLIAYLRGDASDLNQESQYPQNVIDRISWKSPYPLLRHHFGLPEMEVTRQGIDEISKARVLDVISLGTDQDAQENFFHPERQNPRKRGAGGVPIRSESDLRMLKEASGTGNYPLMRAYSGTDDFIRMAEVLVNTIQNAWCAIPLYWFNRMDGRGPYDLKDSIMHHQEVMAWYGARNIPVEINEPHHWGMRDAPDVIYVVSAYLSAINAKAFGVKDYIAQLMLNCPPQVSDAMELAKMLAVLEMIQPLESTDFRIWRQTRTGLLSYPLEPAAARAHLSASIYLQMVLKPHIIHVVSYTEADHAATAEDVIESCRMAQRVIHTALNGQADMTLDPTLIRRKEHLVQQARVTLKAIKNLASEKDAFTDAILLEKAVKEGLLDAPQLKGSPFAQGRIRAGMNHGGWDAMDGNSQPLLEEERLKDWL